VSAIGTLFPFGLIETQVRLAIIFVRAMALKTAIRENRANIPIEIDLFRSPETATTKQYGRYNND
jgi:hypothetical protein